MSRSTAFQTLDRAAVTAFLAEQGVELISGGLDESPMAYKDISEVMAAQADLVDIVARFMPRLVKMAPEGKFKKKRQ
jgi:tRNA-splicing ligase RtcB